MATFIKPAQIKELFKDRSKDVKKYDNGYVIILGGSRLYTGSPALNALAALRTGAGISFVIAPETAARTVASFSPNLIAYCLDGTDFLPHHVGEVLSLIKSAQEKSSGKVALVVGGGLGRDEETQEATRILFSKIDIPAVIDADAIWAVAKDKTILTGKPFVLTPHLFEFFVLSGKKVMDASVEERTQVVESVAKDLNLTIILKGGTDIISNGIETFYNLTGCPEMAVAGTGDTLAGVCGCLLAQKNEPLKAAMAAAYINGAAGSLAKSKLGWGLMATDVIDNIPFAIDKIR